MPEPVGTLGRDSLEDIAMLALEFGRLLSEAGASARYVDEITAQVATGLGAERIDLRVGYASLAITIGIGPDGITRMRKVGPLGVNQTLDLALREAAAMQQGWSLVAASFLAALGVGIVVQLFQSRIGALRNALGVAGCIPMVPGVFTVRAILGLFAVASQHSDGTTDTLVTALEYSLRVAFTIGALGTGLAIPTLLSSFRLSKQGD